MKISITPEDELTVPPLTKEEKSYLQKLQNLLMKCPPRLEFVTIGDPGLGVVDCDGARRSELCDGAASDDGVELAHLTGVAKIHGVSG